MKSQTLSIEELASNFRKFTKFTVEFLKDTRFFQDVSDEELQSIAKLIEVVEVNQNSQIIKQGDDPDCLYFLVEGRLEAEQILSDGTTRILGSIQTRETFGEQTLITGEKRIASVISRSPALVLKLDGNVFQDFVQTHSEKYQNLAEIISKRYRSRINKSYRPVPGHLVKALKKHTLFKGLSTKELEAIEERMQWLFVPGGDLLIRQGEEGNQFYFILSGRMKFEIQDESENQVRTGFPGKSEIVGEMALVSGERRSATVHAVRDTELLSFSREAFLELIHHHPETMQQISKTIIERSASSRGKEGKHRIQTLTILPISHTVDIHSFSNRLKEFLEVFGKTILITKDLIVEKFGEQLLKQDSFEINLWLSELESNFEFVVYCAEFEPTFFTERFLRQADVVYLLTNSSDKGDITAAETRFLGKVQDRVTPTQEMVVIHGDKSNLPGASNRFTCNRNIDKIHNITMTPNDLKRLSRFLAGKAVGLVLGGSGARGFSYLGIYKALIENEIPVDIIGGSSSGAVVGTFMALERPVDAIINDLKYSIVNNKPDKEYTIPFVSVTSGHKVAARFQKLFRGRMFEDTWIPLFSIASNLTEARMRIFDRDELWKSICATASIPGLSPPYYENGNILVDGALLNNLPVDVMKERGAGFVIAISGTPTDIRTQDLNLSPFINKESGFPKVIQILKNRLNPFRKTAELPGPGSILICSIMLGNTIKESAMRKEADLLMHPPVEDCSLYEWDRIDELVETGYRYAMENMEEWKRKIFEPDGDGE